jgi:hypothetical protein
MGEGVEGGSSWGKGMPSSRGLACCRTWGARREDREMHAEAGAGAVGLTCVECSVMVGVGCDLALLKAFLGTTH